MFQTIGQNMETEITEKKSKFIANLIYVTSEEEANEKLIAIRKKYHDARHHCFAYRIQKEDGILQKSSDDGEPSGTAGAPILNLLVQQNLANVLLVVTRYFGGILLRNRRACSSLYRSFSKSHRRSKSCYRRARRFSRTHNRL